MINLHSMVTASIVRVTIGNASGKGIHLENFNKRSDVFYSHWKENKIKFCRGASDAIVTATPPPSGDVINGFSELFVVKDNTEIINVKKAGFLSSCAMNHFVLLKLEEIMYKEEKVTHSSLMEDTKKAVMDIAKVKEYINVDHVDICYPPIFQSGGKFDLSPSASSNEEDLYYDSAGVIICAFGAKYNGYCTNLARTFLVDANQTQKKAYRVLLKAHESAIGALKAGNKVSAAYEAAVAVVKKYGPELVPSLTKTAGTGIGLEFMETSLILNAQNDSILKAGMVFNVSLGFQNLQAQTNNPKTETYSLLLGDTVIVQENTPAVVTMNSSKDMAGVAFPFNEDDEEEDIELVA